MSYFARKVTKHQLLGDDRDGSEVTVVFHSEPKAKSDK